MTVRRQWMLVIAVVAVLGGGLAAATYVLGDEVFPVRVGSRAPSFVARTVPPAPPGTRSLADYEGQVVLLNLWATWCLPCRAEMPSIEALHDDFGRRGLRVVAVSVDDPGMEQAIADFVRERELTFEILYAPDGALQRAYQTSGVPETFVIGRDGVIRKRVIGATNWSSMANRELVAALLDEPAR